MDERGIQRELASFDSGQSPDRRDPNVLGALAWLRAEAAQRRAGWPRIATTLTIVIAMSSLLPMIAALLMRMQLHAAAGCRTRRRDAAGRPYAPSVLAERRESNLAWRRIVMRVARREQWIAVAVLFASTVTCGLIGALAPRSAIGVLAAAGTFLIGFVLFIALLTRMRRRLDRLRLRLKRCLACENRLRCEGNSLRCASCEATWSPAPPRRSRSNP